MSPNWGQVILEVCRQPLPLILLLWENLLQPALSSAVRSSCLGVIAQAALRSFPA
jgi:hypothetical protein